MRIVKLSLLIAICLLCMTACRFHVLDGPVIPWKIENRSEIRITMITGYGGEDYFVPSDFVSQAIITMPPMTRHQAYRNNAHDLDTELKLHSNIEFHFLLEDRSEINSIDISTVKKSMAYFRLNKQWMNDHNWTIIFPDDCTGRSKLRAGMKCGRSGRKTSAPARLRRRWLNFLRFIANSGHNIWRVVSQ